jgi:surface polysaccharide O-acyltransferase-like enzyme
MTKHPRIEGIDYLRAIMSVFVVVWHMDGGGRSLIFSKQQYLDHRFTFSDFLNFHVLLLAVPAFILVSNYLFVLHGPSWAALKRRLWRLALLVSFWPVALTLCKRGVLGLQELSPGSFPSLVSLVVTAGHTIYFFFVSLAVCLVVTHVISALPDAAVWCGSVLSVVFLFSLPLATKMSGWSWLSACRSPLNFIPYSFAAVLLTRHAGWIAHRKALVLAAGLLLAVAFSVAEWHLDTGRIFFASQDRLLDGQDSAIPAYTRTSLLFSTVGVLILALNPAIKASRAVRFMSRHALALYCIHPFFVRPVQQMLSGLAIPGALALYGGIVLVIGLSYAMSIVLSVYLKEDVLR